MRVEDVPIIVGKHIVREVLLVEHDDREVRL